LLKSKIVKKYDFLKQLRWYLTNTLKYQVEPAALPGVILFSSSAAASGNNCCS